VSCRFFKLNIIKNLLINIPENLDTPEALHLIDALDVLGRCHMSTIKSKMPKLIEMFNHAISCMIKNNLVTKIPLSFGEYYAYKFVGMGYIYDDT